MKIVTFTPKYEPSVNPSLDMSPEFLAATFARYSRAGEGLEEILKILEKTPKEKYGETVWKFLDYGHASIGGLTGGIPVGVDKTSMLLPYLSFFLEPKQDGQETSTRYVEFKPEGLQNPASFGIPERFHQKWYEVMLEGFAINKELTQRLDELGKANPELARIPIDAKPKERQRMINNFGFDRARYTLPMAALTNFGLVMTAREWAETIQYLSSFQVPEFKGFARQLRKDLVSMVPTMMKHSHPSNRTDSFADDFLERGVRYLQKNGVNTSSLVDEISVDVHQPPRSKFIHPEMSNEELADLAFEGKQTRYDFAKGLPEKVNVHVEWNNMALAEARDLNRQRPCKKDTLLAPVGFYMPDISQEEMKKGDEKLFNRYQRFLDSRVSLLMGVVNSERPQSYIGCLLLGDQTPFEMNMNAAHFAYVTELRTGRGTHFRYADHCTQAFNEFAKQRPDIAKHIKLGTAEPE